MLVLKVFVTAQARDKKAIAESVAQRTERVEWATL
jgi:hypothetical protein